MVKAHPLALCAKPLKFTAKQYSRCMMIYHYLMLVQYTTPSHPACNLNTLAQPLTLDTLGQPQSPLHIPADGLETVLELIIAVVLLTTTGVIAAVMLVTTFGHGRDAYVKLKKTSLLLIMYFGMTFK